ncbi:site-specific DNA-methyltransferase [Haloprofundus halobius]|uniref:site-specific DNA-methyltransferase n=1 Tax=Haloprofundus halobius TaxID=2876194 RepID=UPI001CCE43B7|nr:site-specific DNA-methyltransferase [Haloprofundus halobius]
MSKQVTRDGNREQLQELLRDLFQFDAADLNFGVYRILNQRRDRIEQFIEEDLLDAVDESLESLADAKRAEIEEELEEKAAELRQDWDNDIFNPDGSLKDQYTNLGQKDLEEYQDLWETREDVAVAEETEARIFNDLYRFFSRYYEDGDFHTKRRISSKDSKYYVPYNGEETYFHWANNDQYYVKTGEHFTDYRFDADEWTVEFRLEEADVPQDNVKGDSRYFVLGRGNPVSTDADEQTVTIRFQYRQITEDEADDYLEAYNEATGDDRSSFAHMTPEMRCDALEGRILDYVENAGAERILTTEKDDDATSTVLKSHLTRYVSENSMDYFVHKNLQEFLEGELEFFLQNEVLDVDELIKADDGSSPPVLRARTVRDIAERIISFLAQIEDFQKRLFEKKKFVVQTDYMVTLDQVPDDLYDEILENDEQLEQWEDVYNTNQWDTDLKWQGEFDQTFLNNHPYVMIDTALFDDGFKLKLLSAFEDLEEATDGVLVNSENFQALNLLIEKYRNEVDCTYIDPPYNTGGRDFIYKDNYQHSSWLSMMADRLQMGRQILSGEGALFANVDDNEHGNLRQLIDNVYGKENFVANVIWEKKYARQNDATWFSTSHDHLLVTAKDKEKWEIHPLPRTEDQNKAYTNPDGDPRGPWQSVVYTCNKTAEQRPNLYYPIEHPKTGEEIWPSKTRVWAFDQETHKKNVEEDRLWWGENQEKTKPRQKVFLDEMGGIVPKTIWSRDFAGDNQKAQRDLASLGLEGAFSNPKPTSLVQRVSQVSMSKEDTLLDFFAGSGTAAIAILQLNREDEGNRDYLMVEMGEYFDTVLRPRIQKRVFSDNWDEGVPEDRDGQTHLVKYHRLESYEDALNNISLSEPSSPQQKLVNEEVEDYILGYMLDFESQDSASLLPEGTFEEPFSHELKIEQNGTSREPTTVDLVETFHYLIGADVRQYWHETHQDRKYVVTECEVDTESGIEKVLTAWRPTEDIDYEEEKDWFDDEFDSESYDRVYVNGESQIAQAEPLEITFREKMEESPNVA